MQDRYVGDVGDFGKYGLLRLIAHETKLRIAVIWYLLDDEGHNADGRHTSYLSDATFAAADPDLHGALHRLVTNGRRSVAAVAQSKILPADTLFFPSRISSGKAAASRRLRADSRLRWLRKAVACARGSDLVFLDPDNGIETPSIPRHSPKAGKYVFWDEMLPKRAIFENLEADQSVALLVNPNFRTKWLG